MKTTLPGKSAIKLFMTTQRAWIVEQRLKLRADERAPLDAYCWQREAMEARLWIDRKANKNK